MQQVSSVMPAPDYPYRHVAWCYDAIGRLYSLGAIDRSKAFHVDLIEPGMRVLYVGAGTGREVGLALERGAAVTCLEPCAAMAKRLEKRTAPWAKRCEIRDIRLEDSPPSDAFDLVVAHYFFNLFDPQTVAGQLDRLIRLTVPGGRVVIADFAFSPRDRLGRRLLQAVYYRPVNLAGRLLGICALHPIYDYVSLLQDRGLALERRAGFRVLPMFGDNYEVLVGRKSHT